MRFVAFFVLIATATTSQALQLPFPNFSAVERAYVGMSFDDDKVLFLHNDASTTAIELVDKLNGQLQSCAALLKVNDLKELLRMIGTPAIPASCDPTVIRTRVGYYYALLQLSTQYLETPNPNGYDSSASSSLKTALTTAFGSLQGFIDKLDSSVWRLAVSGLLDGLAHGKGSVWLCVDSKGGVAITTTAGLDNPLMDTVVKPSCAPIFRLSPRDIADDNQDQLDLSYVDWKVVSDRFAAAVPPKPKAVEMVPEGDQCGGPEGDGCGGQRKCIDAPWDGFQCDTGLECVKVFGWGEYWQCRPIGSNWGPSNWGRKLAL